MKEDMYIPLYTIRLRPAQSHLLRDSTFSYRIIWHIRPPYVARARQMPSLRGGLIAKGFTMVDGLCAIQILQRRSAWGGLICQIIR
jgi:hypothetical protein